MKSRVATALGNLPITRKLTLIIMLTSSVALLLASLTFMGYELLVFRGQMVKDMETTAAIVGDNSSAALAFNDPASAEQTLDSLNTHANIVIGAIYDKDGHLFATYRRNKTDKFNPPPLKTAGHRFEDNHLKLFSDISLSGESIGTVYIQSDMEEIRARMLRYALIAVIVLFAVSGIAFLLSRKLQTAVSAPISHLGNVVGRVAVEKNYSLRAVKQNNDELGKLIDGFNEMLNQIQQRDVALQEAHTELEKRVEERTEALAHSLSLLNATLDSSTDGIVAYEFRSGLVCYNGRYKAIWNLPDALFQKGTDQQRLEWIAAQIKDSENFMRRQRELVAKRGTEAFEVLELKDGRIIERYIRPQLVDGEKVGVVATFRDITERKRAEKELENVHRQLLESSRQAGMAEVATGVLHNVGNVLNSVNVSANLLTESAKRSKIASLAKLTTLLEEHKDDPAAFIAQDPRGQYLPQYLIQLSQHLLTEQQAGIKELESLRSSIDHIKQIVTMQQAYSKVSGMKEIVQVADLIEDALRLNESGLQRHGVRVLREFEAVPALNTQKHKILQILVNLVRNAKYACSDSGRQEKCVSLRLDQHGNRIRISVIDNGVGIAPENLTRIFSHGFTTRKDGHGFGLHSGALAARELGGSLRAHSDGSGKGATFTLELPLETAEESECLSA